MAVNKVILVGNLGADPESKTTPTGLVITNLRIATTERRKSRDTGEWTDHTEWHRVSTFGRTAESCAKYLAKGRQVYIEGRLSTRKWQDRDGNDRWSTEVVANDVKFLAGGRRDGGGFGGGDGGGGGFKQAPTSGGAAPAPAAGGYGDGGFSGGDDDDIPF